MKLIGSLKTRTIAPIICRNKSKWEQGPLSCPSGLEQVMTTHREWRRDAIISRRCQWRREIGSTDLREDASGRWTTLALVMEPEATRLQGTKTQKKRIPSNQGNRLAPQWETWLAWMQRGTLANTKEAVMFRSSSSSVLKELHTA